MHPSRRSLLGCSLAGIALCGLWIGLGDAAVAQSKNKKSSKSSSSKSSSNSNRSSRGDDVPSVSPPPPRNKVGVFARIKRFFSRSSHRDAPNDSQVAVSSSLQPTKGKVQRTQDVEPASAPSWLVSDGRNAAASSPWTGAVYVARPKPQSSEASQYSPAPNRPDLAMRDAPAAYGHVPFAHHGKLPDEGPAHPSSAVNSPRAEPPAPATAPTKIRDRDDPATPTETGSRKSAKPQPLKDLSQESFDDQQMLNLGGFYHKKLATKNEGWKIHVSADPANPEKIMVPTINKLLELGVAFKVWHPDDLQKAVQEKSYQAGKYITIYPNDPSEMVSVAKELRTVVPTGAHQKIAGDQQAFEGAPIYYRYGGHTGDFLEVPANFSLDAGLKIESGKGVIKGSKSSKVKFPDDSRVLNDDQLRIDGIAAPPWKLSEFQKIKSALASGSSGGRSPPPRSPN